MIASILTRLPERWQWKLGFQGVRIAFIVVAACKSLKSWVDITHFVDKLRGELVDEHGLRKVSKSYIPARGVTGPRE